MLSECLNILEKSCHANIMHTKACAVELSKGRHLKTFKTRGLSPMYVSLMEVDCQLHFSRPLACNRFVKKLLAIRILGDYICQR